METPMALPPFRRPRLAAAHYRVEGVAGTVGRIACRRRDFLYLQGYDEEDDAREGASFHGDFGYFGCDLVRYIIG